MKKKIDLMHEIYGEMDNVTCRTCPHLTAHRNGDCTRVWYKCRLYGTSCGPGMDWRCGYTACNGFTIPEEEAEEKHLYGQPYRMVKGLRDKQPEEQLPGQLQMEF